MKKRMKYFAVQFVTDLYLMDTEYELFCAESAESVERELKAQLGNHLLSYEIRKATWAQRRYAKKYPSSIATL